MRKLVCRTLAAFIFCVGASASIEARAKAHAGTPLTLNLTHHLVDLGDAQYQVNGDDPFLIFDLTRPIPAEANLVLDFGSQLYVSESAPLHLELFYQANDNVFSPFYRADYRVSDTLTVLSLPQSIPANQTQLRLDLVNCGACIIQAKASILIADTSSANAVSPTNLSNGLEQLDTSKTLDLSTWQSNHIEGDVLNGFSISGEDPFIFSPELSVSTEQLAGVYFRLNTPIKPKGWQQYQLFYQTNQHGYSALINSNFRIGAQQNATQDQFFIPLAFLAKEVPIILQLKGVRLDIPDIEGQWSVDQVRLISDKEAEAYLKYTPELLLEYKFQRARGLSLVKKIITKLTKDAWFMGAYLLLLVIVIASFARAYRRAS